MTVAARLTQSQRQTLGFRQIQAVNLLRLSNEELVADLTRRAAANPFLRLRLPAAAAPVGVDPEDSDSGLYAHVFAQLRMIGQARSDPTLALAFVEALDGNGWLERPLTDIAASAGRTPAQAAAMLDALQQGVEPVGLFAADLADCLRLQARDRGQLTDQMQAVLRQLDLLASGGVPDLAQAAGISPAEAAQCLDRIRRMDPRPGLCFGASPAPLRAPDVIVSRSPLGWQIALNRSTLPDLSLTQVPDAGVPDVGAPDLRAIRAEAEWLANVVERRNRTVLAVAKAVLMYQRGFLDHGPGAILALSRLNIAAALGLHDSTVGRVARDLLVETPHGLRSLCSLFYSGPERAGGKAASALRLRLGQLIAAENPQAPLADAALAQILRQEGNLLARRTVAKYREELGIPPCSQRRRTRCL